MKIILAVLFASFTMLSSLALAADPAAPGAAGDKKDEGFQKHKQETLGHLDQMITAMQKMKTCVSSAKVHDEMKACHESQKKEMQSLEEKGRDHRKEMIDEQIKRLQDEKAKMNQTPPPAGK